MKSVENKGEKGEVPSRSEWKKVTEAVGRDALDENHADVSLL